MTEDNTSYEESLWNDEDTERFTNETYNRLLIEQYKVYQEMLDRIHTRRIVTNIFFLVFHAAVIGILGLSLSRNPFVNNIGLLLFPLLGLLVLCYAWWRLVQYFRRLNRAKDIIISTMEKRLPSTAFAAERQALIKNKPYNPLRRMELYLPFIFALLYLFSYGYVWHLSIGIN